MQVLVHIKTNNVVVGSSGGDNYKNNLQIYTWKLPYTQCMVEGTSAKNLINHLSNNILTLFVYLLIGK